ncbi:hypothetical protein HanRHA438_Chr13g0627841 [Helianthus annuus]|nr:hypothetical protein HanRHA438_Chr13g0627841 [Helianthus annuus]
MFLKFLKSILYHTFSPSQFCLLLIAHFKEFFLHIYIYIGSGFGENGRKCENGENAYRSSD